jgi:23S rRNA (uracil1939-C5)-methyltransferase
MEYVAQVKAKERVLHHVLQRAELNAKELLPSVPSPHFYHYRNRIQLHQREGRWGFYKKNSREWVGIEQCLLAKEEINQALKELKAKESNVEISVNESGEVKVFSDEKSLSFQQVNSEQNDFLKASVSRFTNKFKSRYVLELYCGEGNLSFSVNGSLEYLLGIDSSELAIQKAMSKTDSKRHFVARSIDSELISHLPKDFVSSYDTLILDPPRTGVGKCITTFLNPSLKNIFYVSCSPVTFSHDAKKLVEKGFILNSVQMVDMFPQTHHIELIAEFSR